MSNDRGPFSLYVPRVTTRLIGCEEAMGIGSGCYSESNGLDIVKSYNVWGNCHDVHDWMRNLTMAECQRVNPISEKEALVIKRAQTPLPRLDSV